MAKIMFNNYQNNSDEKVLYVYTGQGVKRSSSTAITGACTN